LTRPAYLIVAEQPIPRVAAERIAPELSSAAIRTTRTWAGSSGMFSFGARQLCRTRSQPALKPPALKRSRTASP